MAELREANVRLLVVFPSPQKRIDKYYPPSSTPFLVLSDTAEKLYDALGAQTSVLGTLRTAIDLPVVVRAELSYRRNPLAIDGPFTRQPADYLVRDGTIERIRLGRRLGGLSRWRRSRHIARTLWRIRLRLSASRQRNRQYCKPSSSHGRSSLCIFGRETNWHCRCQEALTLEHMRSDARASP